MLNWIQALFLLGLLVACFISIRQAIKPPIIKSEKRDRKKEDSRLGEGMRVFQVNDNNVFVFNDGIKLMRLSGKDNVYVDQSGKEYYYDSPYVNIISGWYAKEYKRKSLERNISIVSPVFAEVDTQLRLEEKQNPNRATTYRD